MRKVEIVNHEDVRGHRGVVVKTISDDPLAPEASHVIQPGRTVVFHIGPGERLVVTEPTVVKKPEAKVVKNPPSDDPSPKKPAKAKAPAQKAKKK